MMLSNINQRKHIIILLLFFASFVLADTAVADEAPEPDDEDVNPIFVQDETIPGFLLKEDVGEARFLNIDIIPKCVLSCVYDRVLDYHCAHSDYLCVCNQITRIAAEEKFQSCFTDCNYLHDQNYAPGAILDFCGEVGVYVEFPPLLARFQHLHRRQSGFASGSLGPSDGGSASFPTETIYETTYTTLPWGNSGFTATSNVAPDGIATVVIGIAISSASSTAFVTETLASNAQGFTSTFTNLRSAVITEIIGVPAGQTPAPRPTTSKSSTSTNTGSSPTNTGTGTPSSGLSTGTKIGIGVAIPLVFLALLAAFLIWWFKYRNRRPGPGPMIQETDDGGLPEPVGPGWASGAVKDALGRPVSQPPPAYHGPDAQSRVGAGGTPIHELNNNEGLGAQGGYGENDRQEMSAIPSTALHELGSKTPTLSLSSVARKPLSPTPSVPSVPAVTQTSSFAPPWDRTGEEEFAYSGPVSAAPKTEEELEVERMEQEMAQVRLRKQRLLDVQRLEEREEELRRKIEEKRNTGGGGPAGRSG